MKETPCVERYPDIFKKWLKGEYKFKYAECRPFEKSIEDIIKELKEQFNITIPKQKIKKYCNQNLIESAKAPNGKLFFPAYTSDRINFIKECIQSQIFGKAPKHDYKKLRRIIAYQREIIIGGWLYNRKYPLKLYTRQVEFWSTYLKKTAKPLRQPIAGFEKDIILVKQLKGEEWRKLSKELKQKINERIFGFQILNERICENRIAECENKILQGYSPQVFFKPDVDLKRLSFDKIDWNATVQYVKGTMLLIDFFMTPLFSLVRENKKMEINILDTYKIKATIMRKIDKIYNALREKDISPILKRKEQKKQRNEAMKMAYHTLALKTQTGKSFDFKNQPIISSHKRIQIVANATGLSYSRTKKIIHSTQYMSIGLQRY